MFSERLGIIAGQLPEEQIGAWIKVVCDGTFWLCTYSGGTTGAEYTAAFAYTNQPKPL